ncbi:HAD hydrolase-like protein [Microbispora sp. NPDC046933]|uniref:HAD hydrolase-like protein n=1 Tax=Microbispora sp. NPDC046933 TaxID=3155618 RepID=UPI0033EE9989
MRSSWVIGDNPTTGIAGGRAAGLRTIWIGGGAGRVPAIIMSGCDGKLTTE